MSQVIKVYSAGPPEPEWRRELPYLTGIQWMHPTLGSWEVVQELMALDIILMNHSDMMLSWFNPSDDHRVGTSWEMGYMRAQGKIVVLANERPNTKYAFPGAGADIVRPTLAEALEVVKFIGESYLDGAYLHMLGRDTDEYQSRN